MSGWEGAFKPAVYGPPVAPAAGPWRTLTSPGELAPQDLAAAEVLHFLRSDATLQRVFGSRFDRVPWLSSNYSTFPRLSVYLTSMQSSERPTATSLERTSIFVGTLWDLASAAPLGEGAPSVATVLAHIKRVLRAAKNRVLTVYWQDEQVALAEVDLAFGGEAYGDVLDVEGRPLGVVHQVEAIYTLKVDKTTGQFTRLGSPPT